MPIPPNVEAGRGRPSTLISYASEDEEAAAELTERLLSAGYGVWRDKYCLLAGRLWAAEIRTAIAQADAFLFLVSRASTTKNGFVHKELKLALDSADERPAGRNFLYPLRLDDATIPDQLADRHYVDLRQPHGFERLKSSLDESADDLWVGPAAERPAVQILRADFRQDADVMTIDYMIRSGGPALVQLGASLVGADGRDHFHRGDDRWLWVAAGTAVYRRYLRLASVPRPGPYSLVVSASHGKGTGKTRLASKRRDEPLFLR